MKSRPPFLAWPGRRVLAEAVVLGTAQTLWWMLVYYGADWVTGMRSQRVRVHLDAELAIPFIPAFILAYRSLDPLFLIGPFVLRTSAQIRALTWGLFCVTLIAGLCFLLLPAEPAYAPQEVPSFWAAIFAINTQIVRRHNMVPSLHVALSTVVLAAYGTGRGAGGRAGLAAWGGLIALSTLLVHEHHVLDVVAGFLLGWAGYRLVYLRRLNATVVQGGSSHYEAHATTTSTAHL
jgi:membrane-associated phospholipid phosphatase